jgi:hypothetical protein
VLGKSPQARKPVTCPSCSRKAGKIHNSLRAKLSEENPTEAIEKDMKDYEVVKTALNEYFTKQK